MSKLSRKIFDLNNDSDLPVEIQDVLKNRGISRDTRRILSLFDVKSELTPAEVMVGLYRAYKISKKLNAITTALHKLAKCGLIKRLSRGVYAKAEQRTEEPSNG